MSGRPPWPLLVPSWTLQAVNGSWVGRQAGRRQPHPPLHRKLATSSFPHPQQYISSYPAEAVGAGRRWGLKWNQTCKLPQQTKAPSEGRKWSRALRKSSKATPMSTRAKLFNNTLLPWQEQLRMGWYSKQTWPIHWTAGQRSGLHIHRCFTGMPFLG